MPRLSVRAPSLPRALALPLIALLAAGCVIEPEPIAGGPGSCDAEAWAHLVGQHRDVFAAMTFPAPMRIIEPGDAITMDHNPARLNVVLDARGRVARVYCG